MGEKDGKRGDEKQNTPESGPTTVVLKVDLHCEGCAQKVKRCIKRVDGVESVSADMTTNKLTVVGKVDPVKLRERVEEKTKKKVEIVSPAGKAATKPKDGGADAKKLTTAVAGDGAKEVKMAAEKKAKAPQASNAVLNIRLIQTIRKKFYKGKGVEGEKKDTGGGGGGKGEGGEKKKEGGVGEKKKEGGLGGEDKKEGGGEKKKEGGGSGDNVKEGGKSVEMNKMEYYGAPYGYQVKMASTPYEYRYNMAPMPSDYPYEMSSTSSEYRYEMAPVSSEYRYETAPTSSIYQVEMAPSPYGYGAEMTHAPQMFSDENPNACSIM